MAVDADRAVGAVQRHREQGSRGHRRPGDHLRPLAFAGYTFLRDDELEPYRGRALIIRAGLCGLAYAALWGAYMPLPMYGVITGEAWQWVFVAPVFIAVGAAVACACLDLEFGSAAMHYCFYVVVTLLLRAALGLPPLWAVATATS